MINFPKVNDSVNKLLGPDKEKPNMVKNALAMKLNKMMLDG
jgi:hypothetical protein